MKTNKERLGLLLLAGLLLINAIIAMRFYNLKRISIPNFYYYQFQKNEVYDPTKRY